MELPTVHSRFENRLRELEEKLSFLSKSEDATGKHINENLQKLSQILKTQKNTREIVEEKKTKEIRAAETSVCLEVA